MRKIFLSFLLTLTMIGYGEKSEASIIVYTNSGSNGRAQYLEEEAKKAGFDINVVAAGGTDIANRLSAEKNNPIADVVFGLNNIEYEKLKKKNVLRKFTPSWAKDIPAGLSDKDGYYNAVSVTPLIAIYNPQVITGKNIPKDWTDLATNPYYKDKYNLFKTGGGTGKTILASIISRYKDSKGELGISKEGWDIIKKLYENGHVEKSGEDWFGNLMSGKRPITMIWASGAIERQNANNFKVGIMKPEIGVPFVVEHVAIINKKKFKPESEKFAEWLGSVEVQGKWSEKFGTAPALPVALEKAPKQVTELVNSLKVQKLDWTFIANNVDAWMEKIELEYNN